LQRSLLHICFPGWFESRETWSINSSFQREATGAVLLVFGQIIKESKPEYPLKVSQSTLAEMVGTTRARVSKFMNVFKKKGLVGSNGGLQINPLTAFLQNRPLSVSTKA